MTRIDFVEREIRTKKNRDLKTENKRAALVLWQSNGHNSSLLVLHTYIIDYPSVNLCLLLILSASSPEITISINVNLSFLSQRQELTD